MDLMYKIKNLKDNEIDEFINERLSKLKNDEERTVAFNSNNHIYNGFFDEKIRINTTSLISNKKRRVIFKYAGFKINDNHLYKVLIDYCKKINDPFLAVTFSVDDYLGLRDESRKGAEEMDRLCEERTMLYKKYLGKTKTVPITFFHDNKIAFCSEISAVAQNMFKFLNVESDFVTGEKDDEDHAYNIVYPWGRENDAILFDACRNGKSDTHLYLVDSKNKTKLFSGEEIELYKENIENAVYKLYDTTVEITNLDGVKYSINNVTYIENDKYSSLTNTNKYKLVFKKN